MTAVEQCGHHLWGDPTTTLVCVRVDQHEPGKGCRYEHGSHVDDTSRDDGGHG